MEHHSSAVEVDPQQLKEAETLWHNFTKLTKYGIIAICILLVFMGLVFL